MGPNSCLWTLISFSQTPCISGRKETNRDKKSEKQNSEQTQRQNTSFTNVFLFPLRIVRLRITGFFCYLFLPAYLQRTKRVMNVSIWVFWAVTPCWIVGGNRRFGGTHCRHPPPWRTILSYYKITRQRWQTSDAVNTTSHTVPYGSKSLISKDRQPTKQPMLAYYCNRWMLVFVFGITVYVQLTTSGRSFFVRICCLQWARAHDYYRTLHMSRTV